MCPVWAQSVSSWNGGTGNWSNPAHWDPNGDPNSEFADVYLNSDSGSLVSLDGDRTIGRLTIGSGDELVIASSNTWFFLVNGGFAGAGRLSVDGLLSLQSGRFNLAGADNQTIDFVGSGTVALGGSSATIDTQNHSGVTLNNGVTIQGAGSLGSNRIQHIHNTGRIVASGGILNILPVNYGTFTNAGEVLASAGSTIALNGNYVTYHNSDRTMTADGAGAMIYLDATSSLFESGSLAGINGGVVRVQSDSLKFHQVTFTGETQIAANYIPDFTGTTTLHGVMNVESTGALEFGDTIGQSLSLVGSGTVVLNNAQIRGGSSGVTLTSAVDVMGNGSFGWSSIAHIINSGTITASGGTLFLSPVYTGTFTNAGHVRATAGSQINLGTVATYLNTGKTMTADGAGSEIFVNGSGGRVVGGTLEGINGGKVLIHTDSMVFQDVTFAGTSEIQGNYYPIFTGSTVIDGTMTAKSTARVRFGETNGVTEKLYGSGTLVLNNAQVTSAYEGVQFENHTTIRGYGTLGANKLAGIVNAGSLTAAGGDLNLLLSGSGNFLNHGVVAADNANFVINGDWTKASNFIKDAYTPVPIDPTTWRGALVGGKWVASGNGGIVITDTSDPRTAIIYGNSADVTLSGTGAFITGFSNSVRINEAGGIIRVLDGQAFSPGVGGFTNHGLIEIGAGSAWDGPIVSTEDGVVLLDGTLEGGLTSWGRVTGVGRVTDGDMQVLGGTVGPGHSIGRLSVEGEGNDYIQTGGEIVLEIGRSGGLTVQDQITALDGNILISNSTVVLTLLTGSEHLKVGDSFSVLQANYLNDGSNLTLSDVEFVFDTSLAGYTFETFVGGDALTFQVTSAIPEPGSVGLLALGLAALVARRRPRA
jgi:hypothetical protein